MTDYKYMLKKISAGIVSSVAYIISSTPAFAQNIIIKPPTIDNKPVGYTDLGDFINKSIGLIFIVAVITVLVMLVWGGMQWILSGGEKEAVGEARKRIINALIGLAILAVAFAIAQVAGTFLGFNILGNLPIPSPAGR